MPFCFLSLRPAREGVGFEPDFPEGISFGLLADCRAADFGLYHYTLDDEAVEEWKPPSSLSPALEELLASGTRYPPALAIAIARSVVAQEFREELPTIDEFAAAYSQALQTHLQQQPTAGYFLAKVVREEVGYSSSGQWYWVLRLKPSDPSLVEWFRMTTSCIRIPWLTSSCRRSSSMHLGVRGGGGSAPREGGAAGASDSRPRTRRRPASTKPSTGTTTTPAFDVRPSPRMKHAPLDAGGGG